MEIKIAPATQEEAFYICRYLRKSDEDEIWAAHRKPPQELVLEAIKLGANCVKLDGVPAILFGCADYKTYGAPWLLATKSIHKVPYQFVRQSVSIVNEWQERWELLTNLTSTKNTISINWLKWLGFVLCETYDINGTEFVRFERRK